MKVLCIVLIMLSPVAVGAPVLGIETFESYHINRPTEWMYPIELPWISQGGMKIVGAGRGDAGVFDEDNLDLGDNGTPGGKQHFRSSRTSETALRSSLVIYFPHKVQAFGFYYSGYDWGVPGDPPLNTLTAYYQGGHTRFGPAPAGVFSIDSVAGFDYVGIEEVCVQPGANHCEAVWGLDEIWYAGNLGPVSTPEPGTGILAALGIGTILLRYKRRE